MMSDQLERGEKGTQVDERTWPGGGGAEVMIGGGGDGGGGDEVGRRWQGLRARWCYFPAFTLFLWDFAANSAWTFTLGEEERGRGSRCSLPLTYQQHTKLITFHTKQRFGTESWKATQENDARVPTEQMNERLLVERMPHADTVGKKTMSTRTRMRMMAHPLRSGRQWLAVLKIHDT